MAGKNKKSKGLGKGLGALFDDMEVEIKVAEDGTTDEMIDQKGLMLVDINDIKPNSKQPRQHFDEVSLDELASSIKTHGVIQPITVKTVKGGFELVAGERRWRAARKAGLSKVPAIHKEVTEEENVFLALIENMQREDLNSVEEAEALRDIMDQYSFTQEEVASSIGKSRAYVANVLRLLRLPDPVREYILTGKLTGGHGKAIGMIKDEETQIKVAEQAVEMSLSVHDIEKIASDISNKSPRKKSLQKRKSKEVKQVEDELTSIMGTKVDINHNGSKGKVELHYYSNDELDEIIDILRSLR